MTWDQFDRILSVVGLVVPVMSLVAGNLNQKIRAAKEQGLDVPTWLLQVTSVLNVLAINLDKANQLAAIAKTQKLAGASNKAIVAEVVAEVIEQINDKEEAKEEKKEVPPPPAGE